MANLFNQQPQLDKLQAEVKMCKKCYIGQLHGPCEVFGEGPPNATVMSISEAAGLDEYKAKAPYRGVAGKYWESMLSTVNLNRVQIYVANVVKSRPLWEGKSNALSPDYQEVHTCLPFLIKQIEIIKPKVILAFGKVATYGLGLMKKSSPLESKVGQHTVNFNCQDGSSFSSEVIVTYHPSYLMRGGVEQQKASWKAYQHLRLAREIINGLALP